MRLKEGQSYEPLYRIEREAEEIACLQWFRNALGRILLRPPKMTPDQAKQDYLAKNINRVHPDERPF